MGNPSRSACEMVNTYEALEHIMGITGLHPHSLSTIRHLHTNLINHTKNKEGVILDIGCGSAYGTYNLSRLLPDGVSVIGIDINKAAIEKASRQFHAQSNLSFFLGSLEDFRDSHGCLSVIGIISVSVSMFLNNTRSFYQTANELLDDGGIFIDAPFVFNMGSDWLTDDFKNRTYQTCGCSMAMHTTNELEYFMDHANFKNIICHEKEFELMNLSILFNDYSPSYLFSQFISNVRNPPEPLNNNSSWYLLRRTLGIFSFFMRHRNKFGAAEIIGVK